MLKFNRKSLFVGVAISLLTLSATAYADVSAEAKKLISDNYKKMCSAINKKDVDGVAKFMTADYKDVAKRRTVNLEGWKTEMKEGMKILSNVMTGIKTKEFKSSGKDVIVTMDMTVTADIAAPDGSKHKLSTKADTKDTWTLKDGKWKCKVSETLSEKQTVDGKPTG